jgi:hypothetical protein
MEFPFEFISVRTFWRILLFIHFATAVGLLALITYQAAAVLMPARQTAGRFVERVRPTSRAWIAPVIALLFVVNFLLGAWVYIKYRTYVRIPMEQLAHWWTVGSFEIKEHVVTFGLALLPAYWYFWREPLSEQHASERKWLTLFLAFAVWYGFLVGHTANDFRGVGA